MSCLGVDTDAVSSTSMREGPTQAQTAQPYGHLQKLQQSEETCKGKRRVRYLAVNSSRVSMWQKD